MYRIVTGVGPHPMPFTVTSAPAGSDVTRNSTSVASSATLPVSACVGVGKTAGSVASSMSPAFTRTASVAATSAIAGASASAAGALAVVTGASADGAAVPPRYHAVATAATAPRKTSVAALDHIAVENGDEPASPRGAAT